MSARQRALRCCCRTHAGGEFVEAVRYASQVWLPAKQVVAAAVAARHEVDASGAIIVLKQVCGWAGHAEQAHRRLQVASPRHACTCHTFNRSTSPGSWVLLHACQGGVPWKEHLFALEEELGVAKPILYVLYEDEREEKWRIQAVPPSAGSFEQRKGLPAAWRGLRDDALSAAAGVPGGVFVHASGFIGGNATYEGALEMARKAVAA
jgi:uncharacterized UPF0160 family protein